MLLLFFCSCREFPLQNAPGPKTTSRQMGHCRLLDLRIVRFQGRIEAFQENSVPQSSIGVSILNPQGSKLVCLNWLLGWIRSPCSCWYMGATGPPCPSLGLLEGRCPLVFPFGPVAKAPKGDHLFFPFHLVKTDFLFFRVGFKGKLLLGIIIYFFSRGLKRMEVSGSKLGK